MKLREKVAWAKYRRLRYLQSHHTVCYASHAFRVMANYADDRAESRNCCHLHDLKVSALIDQLISVLMASQYARVCVSHTD